MNANDETTTHYGPWAPLIARKRNLSASLSPQQWKKFFWLGLVEAAPLVVGGGFSTSTDSKLYALIAAVAALAGTAIVCWLLRDRVRLTRIELSAPTGVLLMETRSRG